VCWSAGEGGKRRREYQNNLAACGVSESPPAAPSSSSSFPQVASVPSGSCMLDESPQPLLPSVIEPGQVYERVVKTKRFWVQVISTIIACGGVHVLVGWVQFTQWGKHSFDFDATVCAVWKAHPPNVALDIEVFADSMLTAFFVSGGQMPQRIRDVQYGRLPRVLPSAFPRGRLLTCLFPRGPRIKGRPPTRHDHCANLSSWFGTAFGWMLIWGGFTFIIIFVLWAAPTVGAGQYDLCMTPWTYIIVRAIWTSIQGACVAAGSYILWMTRGERVLLPSAREPLAPFSPGFTSFTSVN
jgi:hypothetical protein